jgi:hypothetical protein
MSAVNVRKAIIIFCFWRKETLRLILRSIHSNLYGGQFKETKT